jgi:hypothetical protein
MQKTAIHLNCGFPAWNPYQNLAQGGGNLSSKQHPSRRGDCFGLERASSPRNDTQKGMI